MALALETSGTQSTTGSGTEDTLATLTGTKFYQLFLDLNDMVDGDVLTVKAKVKVLSGGTSRLAYSGTYTHTQGEKIVCTVPIASDQECIFTITQDSGTASIPWKVLSW